MLFTLRTAIIEDVQMNIRIGVMSLLSVLGCVCNAYAEGVEAYLKNHQLFEAYQQKVKSIEDDKYVKEQLPKFNNIIETTINSSFNDAYKLSYLHDFIAEFPHDTFSRNIKFSPLYGVRFDPLGSIKYLENLDNRSWVDNFQLMVLWQIYQPEKVATDLYKDIAKVNHDEQLAYFTSGKWQASWRQEEYAEAIGSDYQACYADLKCLLKIIPHWRSWEEDVDIYIPCEVAQKYDMVAYFDVAGGGHGAQSFMISDCLLYDKYAYNDDLEDYTEMLFQESLPSSSGSIRFLYYARSVYNSLISQYFPKFDLEPQARWDIFPYTEWSVLSYYNFSKYNEVLNYGIGYKKALDELIKHYMANFGVTKEQAYNTALATLKIPSMDDWALVKPDNLYYMLLTGQPWDKIKQTHKEIKNYAELLGLSIAYPDNLSAIIREGKIADKDFDIDAPNWFGKTPLMLAAQYGYLDSVKLLLANGADINRQTLDVECLEYYDYLCITYGKRTALMYAMQEGQFDVAKYLIQQGADVSLQDTKGLRAYDYMLGKAFKYNPHVKPTIHGGGAVYWREEDRKSAFSAEQIEELSPLLNVKN